MYENPGWGVRPPLPTPMVLWELGIEKTLDCLYCDWLLQKLIEMTTVNGMLARAPKVLYVDVKY